MFLCSQFNGDISEWDVSNVQDMSYMFESSQFNGDISRWDVSNVTNLSQMLYNRKFQDNISEWDVSNVVHNMGDIFMILILMVIFPYGMSLMFKI
jgi:surface protein